MAHSSTERTAGITTTSGHSYSALGWIMSEAKHGSPEKKEVLVDIPYTNGILDFSNLDGEFHWGPRIVEYTFWQKFGSLAAMLSGTDTFETALRNTTGNLYDDTLPSSSGYWNNARCTKYEHEYNVMSHIATVRVSFRVGPHPGGTTS